MGPLSISIIIPTKNEVKYIGRTLSQFDGLLEAFDLEIIVSDAGSSDGTVELLQQFEQTSGGRIRMVQRPGKQNIAIGRNFGAAQASGEILFHMDADVIIPNKPHFFKLVRQCFQQEKVIAATAPLWIYPEESRLKDNLYHIFMNGIIRLSFRLGVYLAKGECQLVRRSAFDAIKGYNEKLVAGEDCNLFFRLHKIGKIVYLSRLSVHHSPRRFREYGYMGVSWIYLREGLSLVFLRKSYVDEWEPIR